MEAPKTGYPESDPKTEYKEEIIIMASAKRDMKKCVKRLEDAIQEFTMWQKMDSPEISLIRSAEEATGHMEAVKRSWTKIDELSEVLKEKLILARTGWIR